MSVDYLSLVHSSLMSAVLGHRCHAIQGFNLWNETSMSFQAALA